MMNRFFIKIYTFMCLLVVTTTSFGMVLVNTEVRPFQFPALPKDVQKISISCLDPVAFAALRCASKEYDKMLDEYCLELHKCCLALPGIKTIIQAFKEQDPEVAFTDKIRVKIPFCFGVYGEKRRYYVLDAQSRVFYQPIKDDREKNLSYPLDHTLLWKVQVDPLSVPEEYQVITATTSLMDILEHNHNALRMTCENIAAKKNLGFPTATLIAEGKFFALSQSNGYALRLLLELESKFAAPLLAELSMNLFGGSSDKAKIYQAESLVLEHLNMLLICEERDDLHLFKIVSNNCCQLYKRCPVRGCKKTTLDILYERNIPKEFIAAYAAKGKPKQFNPSKPQKDKQHKPKPCVIS